VLLKKLHQLARYSVYSLTDGNQYDAVEGYGECHLLCLYCGAGCLEACQSRGDDRFQAESWALRERMLDESIYSVKEI
jgi:hypothetical protein